MKRINKIVILIILFCIITFVFSLNAEIKSDETVTLFPTYAFKTDKNTIRCYVHGWIYEPEEDSYLRDKFLKSLHETFEIPEKGMQYKIFNRRARFFLVDNQRGKSLKLKLETICLMLSLR